MFQVFLLFVLQSIQRIVRCKDVVRIKHLLDLSLHLDPELRKHLAQESLSDLANSMMMRDGSPALNDLISALSLYSLIYFEYLVLRKSDIAHPEVGIHSGSCVIDLGHTRSTENGVFRDISSLACIDHTGTHICAEVTNFTPGARSLEGLCHVSVISSKVSNISNDISEEVASLSVFLSGIESSKSSSESKDIVLLHFHLFFRAFEDQDHSGHFVLIEALNLQDIELLNCIDHMSHLRVLFRLQTLTKQKLKVVHQSHGGCPDSLTTCLLHKLDSTFHVGEYD